MMHNLSEHSLRFHHRIASRRPPGDARYASLASAASLGITKEASSKLKTAESAYKSLNQSI
jgi:hypothetical protein